MAKTHDNKYPQIYGHPTSALPDLLTPLNIEHVGDSVPDNDMVDVADGLSTGKEFNDPLALLKGLK